MANVCHITNPFDCSSGNVSAYTIDSTTGALNPVSGSPFAAEAEVASVAVDPSGKFTYVANGCRSNPFDCTSGNVSAYTIDNTTGALSPISGSPFAAGANPRSVSVDPSGKFAYVANAVCSKSFCSPNGNVSAYTIDSTTGALTPVSGSPFATGSNPSSVAVDPSGKFAYVANQGSNTVSAYTIDSTTGVLTAVTGSPFAVERAAFPRSVAVDPSGKFAYAADQGGFDVWAYTIDGTTGALSPVSGSPFAAGSQPLSMAVDPSGKFAYVANHDSNNVSAYTIDSTTGALSPVSGSPFSTGASTFPLSVAVDPSGKFAYVTTTCISSSSCANGVVLAYTIDSATGALTAVSGSPFAAGMDPLSIAIAGQSVETPAQLITDLINAVSSFNLRAGFDNSLDAKLQAAQASLAANQVNRACRHIDAFTNEVTAQSGKKLTVGQANQLLTQGNFIENSLGCS